MHDDIIKDNLQIMHNDNKVVCSHTKREHTETRESQYGLIKGSYT